MPSILIVDDAPNILRMLDSAFRGLAYDVATAGDGESAIALLRQRSFDVVLSDMEMPRLNGCELARWVAAHCGATHVVLMSGSEQPCDGCPFAPRCTVLRKPFRLDDAIALVERAARRP